MITYRLRPFFAGLLFVLLFGGLLSCADSFAQELTGTTSLILIPVADMPHDGTIVLGGGFVNKAYTDYGEGALHFTPYFASMTFLPFLEVSMRFSRHWDNPGEPEALGDRMLSIRARLLTEKRNIPAVAVGVHDFLQSTDSKTRHFGASYVVASKHFEGVRWFEDVAVHAGMGTSKFLAKNHQFIGPFGGISLTPVQFLQLMAEYDGDHLSLGPRLKLWDFLHVLVAWSDFQAVSGGVSVHLHL